MLRGWDGGAANEQHIQSGSESAARMLKYVWELDTYIANNVRYIVNYGERYRNGERVSTSFTESVINQPELPAGATIGHSNAVSRLIPPAFLCSPSRRPCPARIRIGVPAFGGIPAYRPNALVIAQTLVERHAQGVKLRCARGCRRAESKLSQGSCDETDMWLSKHQPLLYPVVDKPHEDHERVLFAPALECERIALVDFRHAGNKTSSAEPRRQILCQLAPGRFSRSGVLGKVRLKGDMRAHHQTSGRSKYLQTSRQATT